LPTLPRTVALAATAAVLAAAGVGCASRARATPPPPTKARVSVLSPQILAVPQGSTLTATPRGTVAGYATPDGPAVAPVSPTYYGTAVALPVVAQRPGWLQVRVPERPDSSAAWIRVGDATVGVTPWRIVIDLAATHLRLYHAGRLVEDAPVGIGVDATPTATGEFFAAFFQPPPTPGYGPWVLITSGHSEVLTNWEGSGDGILAIHGPLGADSRIASTGAKVSNGCIRMHLADMAALAAVTSGTPIDIVAGPVAA
jgi:lipoprotein-anchoring transpeptidase ErfK/SrfK